MTDHNLILSESAALPKARMNAAIVAIKDGTPFLIRGRIPLVDRVFNVPKQFIEVDTSVKSFDETLSLPTTSDALFFNATVHVSYRVNDPETLIEKGIRNGKDALWPKLRHKLTGVTRSCEKPAEAEKACALVAEEFRSGINSSPVFKNGLEVQHIAVEVRLTDEMRKLLSEVDLSELEKRRIEAKHRLEDLELYRKERIITQGGIPALWAEYLRLHPDAAAEAINAFTSAERERYSAQIQVLRDAINNNLLEDHVFGKFSKDFVERVFARAGGALELTPMKEIADTPRLDEAPKDDSQS